MPPPSRGAVQDQEEEFCRRLVATEMASGPDRPAQLAIERLDGIRRARPPRRREHAFSFSRRWRAHSAYAKMCASNGE